MALLWLPGVNVVAIWIMNLLAGSAAVFLVGVAMVMLVEFALLLTMARRCRIAALHAAAAVLGSVAITVIVCIVAFLVAFGIACGPDCDGLS